MISKTFIFLLSFLGILFLAQQSAAQSQVYIDQAGSAEGVTIDGQTVQKLLDDVIIRTDDMLMEADSAYRFLNDNMIHAFNIQIETERETIWADTLYYDTITDFSQFRGRVIVQSDKNTVFSQIVDYITILEMVIFRSPVRFEDDRGTLIAESGIYYQALDSAVFRGDVQLADSTQYLESDSLFMNRTDDLYELFSRVYADDYEEKVTFSGDYLYADSTGYRLLEEDAWLMEVSESEADTTHILAEKIELQETDTTSTMDAFEDVRIWSNKFSAIADTANYSDNEDKFTLRSSPILWQNNMQLTGPIIEATFEDEDINFLRSFTRPIAVQEDSLTGRLNQMTGDTLHAYFDEGDLERLVVFNNSEIIFHLKNDDEEPDGLMELIAAGASTMYFNDGEFENFKAEQNIDGSHLPEEPGNIDLELENFRWNPDQKPERPSIREPRLPAITNEPLFEWPERYIRYLNVQPENEEQE
ncbi:MAG: OstA-like protein [Balneolaceae bacterium]